MTKWKGLYRTTRNINEKEEEDENKKNKKEAIIHICKD